MKVNFRLVSIALVSLCAAPLTYAAEKKITQAQLPAAVQKTAQAVSNDAIVRAYTKEEENGQTLYEVEMTKSGHSKDVTIGADGTVMEVEEQTEMDTLPPAVQLGLKAKAGKGSITKIETITKHDETVAYEAQIRTGSKRSEIQVGRDGMPLAHEE